MKLLIPLFISCTLVITLSTGSSLANRHAVDPVSRAQSSPLQIDTWNRVATTNWMSKSVQHNLPFAGEIAFTNQKEGWLVGGERAAQPGSIGGPGFVWLYGTTDGGVVWRHQRVPVPSKYRAAITFVSPPALAGSTVFVPVTYQIPGGRGDKL